jgi:hypothetical protein|tara:strand:+ start:568 stop:2169 length:1602 start_codon:yes stop_codon:yes gene_type:complete
MKRFKTLSEVYRTGTSYHKDITPHESSFNTLGQAYLSLYTEETAMKIPNFGAGSVNWNKYRKRLIELISDIDTDIKIHKSHHKRYGIDTFNSSLIVNKDKLIDFINNMPDGVAPKSSTWPTIDVSDGGNTIKVSVGHLLKTGQFKEEKAGQSSTEVKEGLVSLFFALKHTDPVTKENFEAVRLKLREAVNEQFEGETESALEQISKFLGDIEGNGNIAKFRHELNQPLSQAVTLIESPYRNWIPTRGSIFHDVRKAGRLITKFPSDKWNPGDIYLINPKMQSKIQDTLNEIQMNPGEESNLNLLNDLFISNWGDIDRALVSISLKFQNAQGGKAKDFLKKFINEGTKDKPYNLSISDQELDEVQLAAEVARLRNNISNQINIKATDVRMMYDVPSDTLTLEEDSDRLRKKFASLKLVDFLFNRADKGKLDDVIIGAIGFGMSLAGVNPTFFKVIANKQGSGISEPEKFTEKGAVALYPVEGGEEPVINIKDNNTSNKVEITTRVEQGPDIKNVMLSARSNGYVQATLEIERVT